MFVGIEVGEPQIGKDVFVAPNAAIIGNVTLGDNSSVWFNAVLRGDVMPIVIGKETNIQDGTIIHGTYKKCGTTIGERVTVGHGVILHGSTIGDRVLIGMGAVIMDHAKIASDSFIAAGSLVKEGSEFPSGVLIMGRPAAVKRELKPEELKFLNQSADNYLFYRNWYRNMKVRS
jgi:carbonic anhydrase/acetyltransferase-like protein (isoleucine patch superfamily)